MSKYLKFTLALFFISFIFSCSPRYETVYIYNPPKSLEGKRCVKDCELKKKKCEEKCKEEKRKCYKEAIKTAKEIYSLKFEEYKIAYNDYLTKYKIYRRELNNWQAKYDELLSNYGYFSRICSSDKKFCSEMSFYKNLLHQHNLHKPKPPKPPVKPDLSEIIAEQKRKMCKLNCDCTDEFNICFESCGGSINIKKVCVENCD